MGGMKFLGLAGDPRTALLGVSLDANRCINNIPSVILLGGVRHQHYLLCFDGTQG